MLAVLLESSVRAVLLAIAVAATLRALRIHTASARHAAWAGVMVMMLALPLWSVWGPSVPLALLSERPEAMAGPVLVEEAAQGASTASVSAEPAALAESFNVPRDWRFYAGIVYLLGGAIFLLRLFVGTWQATRLLRSCRLEHGTLCILRARLP